MTLELNQIALQVRAMGQTLKNQTNQRQDSQQQITTLLHEFSTAYTTLEDRVRQAEKVQQQQRFEWVGAAPTNEPLAQSYPLPRQLDKVTVIASDGSQILPDQHAIALYYLINVGSIIYRHGSNLKPETFNPKPILCYDQKELLDEQGRLISLGEVNVRRDLAELEVLVDLATHHTKANPEPVITLMDGQLALRVIDLPYHRQQESQKTYLTMLDRLRDSRALLAAYIDRPRSTFVISLMHLASLDAINENSLRHNQFRYLTDVDLFREVIKPGERSAIFITKAKGLDLYTQTGHEVRFFYLNVSLSQTNPILARVEIPAWMAANPELVDMLHATLVRQARLAANYPYVLARAHELAIISTEERQAIDMMLAVEMHRQGLKPVLSAKQQNKNLLTGQERYKNRL